MRKVYMLKHSRPMGEDAWSTELIGFYSPISKAEETIEKFKNITGFHDYPDDFVIEEWDVDIDDFNDIAGDYTGSVFYLAHEYYDGTEFDYITDLGVYSRFKKAKRAKAKYKMISKFIAYPDGFSIDEYEINKEHWTEGFYTY